MGQVTLNIAGRSHQVACRDGEEVHLERLGERLARHADAASRASAGNPERTLLYLALILADELYELERNPSQGISPVLIERLAERLEALASALEDSGAE